MCDHFFYSFLYLVFPFFNKAFLRGGSGSLNVTGMLGITLEKTDRKHLKKTIINSLIKDIYLSIECFVVS